MTVPVTEDTTTAKDLAVRAVGVGKVAGGVGDVLGEVLGQIADVAAGLLRAAEDALHVHLGAEEHRVPRTPQHLRIGRLLPRRQGLAGVRVDERPRPVVPPRHPVPAVDGRVVGRPPDLVVRRGRDGTQLGARGRCDVLICGASFAGLAAARALAASGADVLVVDRYEIGERATSACAVPEPWIRALGLDSVPTTAVQPTWGPHH